MTHGSLFSGIGGFDLAAEWMGWENMFHCEWNEFGQKILKYYWPDATSYGDITKTDFTIWRGRIDVLTGGFPCQPYSVAGKRKGKEDERHLWPEMLRAIREIQPRWIIGENVHGLINWSGGLVFHEVQADLEAEGYEVFPYVLPACGVNAPHRRERVWFVAHSANFRSHRNDREREIREQCRTGRQTLYQFNGDGGEGITTHTFGKRIQENKSAFIRDKKRDNTEQAQNRNEFTSWIAATNKSHYWNEFPTQSPVCSGNDGLPAELDGITFSKWRNESIKGAGNAIVPQVALQLFKTIQQYENL